MLAYHPDKEDEIWHLVGGSGLWKRWYLTVFKALWRKEHPREVRNLKQARYQRNRKRRYNGL